MNETMINGALMFLSGLFFGFFLTNRLNKYRPSKAASKENENEVDFDSVPNINSGSNKLVLIVRNDLKMGKGKVAAQCSHAAVMAYVSCGKKFPKLLTMWKEAGQPKIVLKIDGEEEMMELANTARNSQLLVSCVQDAGRTQIAPGTKTVLAIGPGPIHTIDQVTGHLKLY